MNLGESEQAGDGPAGRTRPPTDSQIEHLLRHIAPSDGLRGGQWTQRTDFEIVDAVTVLDTAIDQPDGLRSAIGLEGRQIVAEGGGVTVVVDVAEGPDGLLVSGEVLDATGAVAIVQLVDPLGIEAGMAICDSFGRFEMSTEPGEYSLVVCTENLEIVVAVALD